MGKLIDGDKLISTLVWGHYELGKELQTVQKAINDMRGEDAVHVIRCKDCKYYEDDIGDCIGFGDTYVSEEEYCSRARRKEE